MNALGSFKYTLTQCNGGRSTCWGRFVPLWTFAISRCKTRNSADKPCFNVFYMFPWNNCDSYSRRRMGRENSESQNEFEEKPCNEKNELFDSQKSSNPSWRSWKCTISDWSVVGSNPVKDVFLCCIFSFFFSFSFLMFVWRVLFLLITFQLTTRGGEQLSIELFVE